MSTTIPSLSVIDNARLNALHFVPYLSRGVITEQPSRVSFWARRQRDPGAVGLIGSLRDKYSSEYLEVRLLRQRAVLVLAPGGIQRVLDASPDVFGPASQKVKRMSHFQPGAVTVSQGAEWRERRSFNVAVLDAAAQPRPCGDAILSGVGAAVEACLGARGNAQLTWPDFDRLFERIMLQVVFGDGEGGRHLAGALKAMMQESNAVIAPRRASAHFDTFYDGIRAHLETPAAGSLAALCAATPSSATTRVENQVPHWMFAMRDTLAINTVRALALIVSHPAVEQQVRVEISRSARCDSAGINAMVYLGACVQEAMRLWPTTMMLVREALRDDVIEGRTVARGTQVVIHNGFNHRDAARHSFADRIAPEIWLDVGADYRFNHLSNGPQECAGKALALFLAKCVLVSLLANRRYRLVAPALDCARALPYVYDHYAVRLEVASEEAVVP